MKNPRKRANLAEIMPGNFLRLSRFPLGISVFWLALSLLTDGINSLVLPSRLQSLSVESTRATTLGLVTFSGLLAGMLLQPLAGSLSDRLKPRIGRVGFLAAAAALALLSLAAFGFSSSLTGLAAAFLSLQVFTSAAQAAQQGFIPDLVKPDKRGSASGWKAFMDIAGAALGFAILGQILGSGKPGLALVVVAIIVLAALALTILLVHEKRSQSTHEHPQASTAHEPAQPIAHQQSSFFWLVASRFLFLLGTYAVGRFLLLFVASRLGLDPESAAAQAGSLLAGLALVTLIAAPFAGRAADRLGRTPIILFGAGVSAAGAVLMSITTSLWQMAACGVLLSLGSAAFASANWALTADLAPPAKAGRFFGLANFGTAGAAAAAGLFGPLIDRINSSTTGAGYTALFWLAALAFILSALAMRGVKQPHTFARAGALVKITHGES